MKILFLDVDGVLNSERLLQTLEKKHEASCGARTVPKRETTCSCFRLDRQIDSAAIARLNRLVTATGALLVVSSSWRTIFDLPTLQRILREHGLVHDLVDATPDGDKDAGILVPEGERMQRGHEIDCWLRAHPDVERFVILDDSGDMAMHKHRLVQTNTEDGLQDAHVEAAILMLTKDVDASAALRLVLEEMP